MLVKYSVHTENFLATINKFRHFPSEISTHSFIKKIDRIKKYTHLNSFFYKHSIFQINAMYQFNTTSAYFKLNINLIVSTLILNSRLLKINK